jgi:hypothetical protein
MCVAQIRHLLDRVAFEILGFLDLGSGDLWPLLQRRPLVSTGLAALEHLPGFRIFQLVSVLRPMLDDVVRVAGDGHPDKRHILEDRSARLLAFRLEFDCLHVKGHKHIVFD